MEKKSAISRINDLKKKLAAYDKAYYKDNDPLISDSEYDQLVVELRTLLREVGNKDDEDTLSQVGSDLTGALKPVKHRKFMGSIRTEVDTSAAPIHEFLARIQGEHKAGICVEMKYDGLAISLIVRGGMLSQAVTRGDGEVGEDVTFNISRIPSIAKYFNQPHPALRDIVEVRGEVLLLRGCLDEINVVREANGSRPFVNNRNAIAGIVRASDTPGEIFQYVVFVPYDADTAAPKFDSYCELIKTLDFLKDHRIADIKQTVTDTAMQTYLVYSEMSASGRALASVELDGMVYKLDSLKAREKLGYSGRDPRWAIAHKFVPEKAKGKLESIDFQVGRYGRYTPVARISPTKVGGVVVTNVTLSNIFQIRRKGIRVGDEVIVQRAGDVIPEIIGRSDIVARRTYVPNVFPPKKCFVCGSDVIRPKGEANYMCIGPDCQTKMQGRLLTIAQRSVFKIDGIGEVYADLLASAGVSDMISLAKCSVQDMVKAGVREGDAVKIFEQVSAVLNNPVPLDKVIQALGIESIGDRASQYLADYVKTPQGLIEMFVHGFEGDTYLQHNLNITNVQRLKLFYEQRGKQYIQEHLNLFDIEKPRDLSNGELAGMSVVVTGSHPDVTRDHIKDIVKRLGGKAASSVSKNTSLVVYGDGAGEKLTKARELNLPMMGIGDFMIKYG